MTTGSNRSLTLDKLSVSNLCVPHLVTGSNSLDEIITEVCKYLGSFSVDVETRTRSDSVHFYYGIDTSTETVVTSEMTLFQFERLISSHLQLIELTSRLAVEEKARETPAVKKAYDHYKMLVDLASNR